MAVQTYCTRREVEDLIGLAGVKGSIDDNEDGNFDDSVVTSGAAKIEDDLVGTAIERGALEINMLIIYQYSLASVASNEWLKWANAWLAAYYLRIRRGNPCEQSILDNVVEIRKILNDIRWGRLMLPGQTPTIDGRPSVSNFNPELSKVSSPIRVIRDESTGGDPGAGVKRNVAHLPGNL